MNSRLRWTFAITSLALFAFTLDRLVVAIALPTIRTDLDAQVSGLEWTVNAYTLSFAVLLLTGAALGDRFGRRRPLGRLRLAETYGPPRRLDLAGVVLGSIGLFGVVWAVIRAGAAGWASAEVSLALGGGVTLLALFVWWEMRTAAPMLPIRFFRIRVFAAGALACVAMYSALFGALFLITQLLQVGMGATPMQAGLRTLPMAVMPLLLAPASGVITDRIGFRPLMICGLAMESVALGWLAAAVTPDVPYGLLVAPLVLAGAGAAVFFAPLTTAMLSAVAPQEQGQASGAATAIRELAVVFGVAGLGLVFTGHGGYASRADFTAGFVPAMWLAALLAAVGLLAAVSLPRRAASGPAWALTDPRPRCENDARDAVSAGAAG